MIGRGEITNLNPVGNGLQESGGLVVTEDVDTLKKTKSGVLKYKLKNANVYVSSGGYHYIDYLDDLGNISEEIDDSKLTEDELVYIENMLQSNAERFESQTKIIQSYIPVTGKRILDVGCGGGLFLSKLKIMGARTLGLELSDSRAAYARSRHELEIIKRTIETRYWEQYEGAMDVVTLWDVIEHVNYPGETLKASVAVLKKGGFIFIDTPCRDGLYHKIGEITYKLSRGRFPTFLNAMYSSHRFGHKQIFSTHEMKSMFQSVGLEVVELRKFHELSFPYSFYLEKIFKSKILVGLILPIVKVSLLIFPVKNKMLVVGCKK